MNLTVARLTTQMLLMFFGFIFAVSYWLTMRPWMMGATGAGFVLMWALAYTLLCQWRKQ